MATKTIGGRVFCLLFGIVGIPFMLSVLADVGGLLAGVMQVRNLRSSFEFLKSFYCILNTVAPSSKVTWGSNKEHALEWAERMGILRTRKVELFLSEALSIFPLSRCHWCDMLSSNRMSSYQVLSGAIRCLHIRCLSSLKN